MRSMFNEEAALALMSDLEEEYNSEAFERACITLNESWTEATQQSTKLQDISLLCNKKAMPRIIQRYGFSPDENGSKEVTALLREIGMKSKDVEGKYNAINTQVLRCFP